MREAYKTFDEKISLVKKTKIENGVYLLEIDGVRFRADKDIIKSNTWFLYLESGGKPVSTGCTLKDNIESAYDLSGYF